MKNMRYKSITTYFFTIVALLLCLFGWALSSPVGSSPDEDYHLASIWCGQGNQDGNCHIDPKDNLTIEVPSALTLAANCFAFHPELSGACDLPPLSVHSLTTRSNQDGGYPKIFYWSMNHLITSDLDSSVLSMRFFNAGLFVLLLTLTYWAVNKKLRIGLAVGAAISLVPLGLFLIPSINPSSWAVTSAVVLWVALTGYFTSDSLKRKILLATISIVALVIGAGARSDAAVYSLLALLVAIALGWTSFRSKKSHLVFTVAFGLIAVYFFFSGHQSQVITPHTPGTGTRGTLDLILTNLALLPQLWTGVFGTWGLGWLDTAMPGIVSVTCLFIFSGFVFGGLFKTNKAKLIAIITLFVALIAIPLYILVNDQVIVGAGVQPRYILPIIILLAGVAVFNSNSELGYSRTQIIVAIVGLSTANMMALHTNFRRYLTGVNTGGVNLNKGILWWWDGFAFTPMFVWITAIVSFLCVIYFVFSSLLILDKNKRISNDTIHTNHKQN